MYFDHCESPQELDKAINDLLRGVTFHTAELRGPGVIPLVGPDENQTLREAFLEARSRAEKLRKVHPGLPEVPDSLCTALQGIRRMAMWCRVAETTLKRVDLEKKDRVTLWRRIQVLTI